MSHIAFQNAEKRVDLVHTCFSVREEAFADKLNVCYKGNNTSRPLAGWRFFMSQFPWFLVQRSDIDYPAYLAEITDPPETLYVRGDRALLRMKQTVSIVGTRRPTSYGTEVVRSIMPELVRAGFVTVSGLAFGIDGLVHAHTLDAGGKTIAVVAGGVCDADMTPVSHRSLAERILHCGGLIISEHPPGTKARPRHFPVRNRIIAGWSMATIVVEAASRSGSLVTARLAREYNREVVAVPGSIFSPVSEGTNGLIAQGATAWSSCASFCGALELTLDMPLTPHDPATDAQLSASERTLLQYVSDEPRTIDQLIELSRCAAEEVLASICVLQLRRFIRDVGGEQYVRT